MNATAVASELVRMAAEQTGVDFFDIAGDGQDQKSALPRHAIILALRRKGYSHRQIGRLLQRDHSAIQHAEKRAQARLSDPWFAALVEALE